MLENKVNFFARLSNIFASSPSYIQYGTILIIILVILIGIYYFKEYTSTFAIQTRTIIKGLPPNPSTIVFIENNILHPIYILALIEVTNKQPVPVKIQTYWMTVRIDRTFVRMNAIPTSNMENYFYRIANSNLKTCIPLSFDDGLFENKARGQILKQGDTLKGWVLFDLPNDKKNITGKINKIFLYIQDSFNNVQKKELCPKSTQGQSWMNCGSLKIKGGEVDLSKFKR